MSTIDDGKIKRLSRALEAAEAELAALREELAEMTDNFNIAVRQKLELSKRLAAAEQRNAELVELLRAIKRHDPDTQCMTYPMHRRIDAALKPTESGAGE